MLKPEQVPDAAAQAAHDVFWNAVHDGKPIDLDIECHRLFHYAIAAAINAWPGAKEELKDGWNWQETGGVKTFRYRTISIPLQENTDAGG